MNGINLEPLDDAIEWAAREAAGEHIDGEPAWQQHSWLNLNKECGTACCIAGRIALDAGYVPTATNRDGDVEQMSHPQTGDEGTPAGIAYRIVLGLHAEDHNSEPHQIMDDLTDGNNDLADIQKHRDALARLAASGWE